MDSTTTFKWLDSNWFWIVLATLVVLVVWRFAKPLITRGVVSFLETQGKALDGIAAPHDEILKRAATIVQLLNSLVRLAVLATFVLIIFAVLNLWGAIAGLGLLGAALTVAGQSIVLDYLMGLLILMEGQYYTGDTINGGGVEGLVEEVGLRRTVVRDAHGTVHSISNGLIRMSSNLTRIYATAVVDLPGVNEQDVEAAIVVMDRVGAELAADPAWADRLLETPRYTATTAFTDLGMTLRMTGRVKTPDRWSVPAELRRRLASALREAGIETNRRTAGTGTSVE